MFTGLVSETGIVRSVERVAGGDGARIRIDAELAAQVERGDSVAVNGVCLTAVESNGASLGADVMAETLRRSSLGPLAAGDRVNLELPPRAGDRLGGHLVQGHVDGLATITAVTEEGLARLIRVEPPAELLRYVVEKGSVALDGVSLTVVEVDDDGFVVSLIPETLARTTLGAAAPGRPVNLEVDVLAKYVERLAVHA